MRRGRAPPCVAARRRCPERIVLRRRRWRTHRRIARAARRARHRGSRPHAGPTRSGSSRLRGGASASGEPVGNRRYNTVFDHGPIVVRQPASPHSFPDLPIARFSMTARIIDGKARAAAPDRRRARSRRRPCRRGTRAARARRRAGRRRTPRRRSTCATSARTTEAAGMRSFAHDLPATTSQAELLALVDALNARSRGQRHPGAAAAAEAHRRRARDRAHRSAARTSTASIPTTSAASC